MSIFLTNFPFFLCGIRNYYVVLPRLKDLILSSEEEMYLDVSLFQAHPRLKGYGL